MKNSGIIKVSNFYYLEVRMNIIEKLNKGQTKTLERIARAYGFFFRNEGSQELREDGKYVVHVDFDTGSAATISPLVGQKIAESKAFRMADEVYFRGLRIWPLQAPMLF